MGPSSGKEMRKIVLLLIGVLAVTSILFTCFPFNHPLDPESENYIGFESEDNDGDGIGQWGDVDEIELIAPADGETITTLPVCLITNKFNPDKIWKYWIQLSTSDSDFDGSIVFSKDDYASNECVIPPGVMSVNLSYYWRVRAFDGIKWSDNWPDARSFVVDVDTSVPWFPSPSDGATIPDTTPLLDWEDVAGAAGYHTQVNTNNSFTGTMVGDDSTITASQYQVTTMLAVNTTYYWRVKTKNADGVWSEWGNTWSLIIDVEPPINPSPYDGATTWDTTPLLDWEDVAGAAGYHAQVNTNDSFTGTMVGDDSTITTSQYQVTTTLTDNTTYYWRVKAKNADGVWSEWGNTWSLIIDVEPPINPSPYDGATTWDTTPLLDWEDVAGAAGYHAQVNTNDSFTGTMVGDDSTITTSQYQVTTTLTDNTTYYWRVKMKNDDGAWSEWGDTWSFTVIDANKITAFDGAEGDSFGSSVAISGDKAIIGADHDDDTGSDSGSAYSYYWNGSNWVEQQKLTASDGAAYDMFGCTVAIDGDRAIVGAWGDADSGIYTGSAYIFHWNGSSWVEQQKLIASDGASGDEFGESVAINGDRAIVGASGDDSKGVNSGSAYIYHWNSSSWSEKKKLTANDGTAGDGFGMSVAISGDRTILGAWQDDDCGSAYIYHWNGSSWVEQQKLTAVDATVSDIFGESVTISGEKAIVGAYHDDDNGNASGSAYHFEF